MLLQMSGMKYGNNVIMPLISTPENGLKFGMFIPGGIRPVPKLISFSDGKKALLPLSLQPNYRGLVKTYLSSPAGTFGGWIDQDKLEIKHAILLANLLTQKMGNLCWRVNPYDELALKTNIEISREDETHALNLSNGFDAIYKGWTKGHSSAARKARKAGVFIRLASQLDDWQSYYRVYEDSLNRWGEKASCKYDWKLFEEIFHRHSHSIRLWLAIYQEEIVAGALCFHAKRHVVYWHGAALDEYFNLRPVNLLMYEIIKNACEEKYLWFDFNPSGGHEGVKSFKKSFGAQPLACPIINKNTMINRSLGIVSRMVKRFLRW
jgi:hypothetical protein